MAKRRRGGSAHREAETRAGARLLVEKIADDLGIGIVVGSVVDGPPCQITAFLGFGTVQTEVTVFACGARSRIH